MRCTGKAPVSYKTRSNTDAQHASKPCRLHEDTRPQLQGHRARTCCKSKATENLAADSIRRRYVYHWKMEAFKSQHVTSGPQAAAML